jgi:excisionase family DNA binding protein
MSSEHEESFLTVADVAELLKLNQQTVRNWIDQGSMPAVRVGRRVRVKRSDLNRIIAEGYQGGGGTARIDGPSAADFWGGQPVGEAELDPDAPATEDATTRDPDADQRARGGELADDGEESGGDG